jgi:hypothetical protein
MHELCIYNYYKILRKGRQLKLRKTGVNGAITYYKTGVGDLKRNFFIGNPLSIKGAKLKTRELCEVGMEKLLPTAGISTSTEGKQFASERSLTSYSGRKHS